MTRGKLKRSERALNTEEIEALLKRCLVGRVATTGSDDMPYITPLNYVYEPQTSRIYLHHSSEPGHLLDNLRHNNRVCFEADEPGVLFATGEFACNTGQVYQSVICFGRMSLLETVEEKKHVLWLFTEKYIDGLMPDRKYKSALQQVEGTAVLAIDIEIMTGKYCKAPS